MTSVFGLLAVQALVGAFDNLWHHELSERLPSRPSARRELALHTVREFLYAVLFAGLAWRTFEGVWALALAALLAVEIAVTLADFVEEDRTRRLPRFERVLHTLLALNFGAVLAVWAPELAAAAGRLTALSPAHHGLWSWLFSAFALGALAWAARDLVAVVRLGVPEWRRNPIRAAPRRAGARTVLVTGATGFIGRAVVRALLARGDRVLALTRDLESARDRLGPLVEAVDSLDRIDAARDLHAIVNLAGEPLAGGRWTARRKRVFLSSRLAVTDGLVALLRRLDRAPVALVSASAIGFYGDRGDEPLDEKAGGQRIFMSELCRRWEEAAEKAAGRGVRVCALRIGLVLGRHGGALPALAAPARVGLGAVFGGGRQWVSWIHLDDLVRLILKAVDEPVLRGAINATAPEAVRHCDFMRIVGATLGRPILLRAPAVVLRRLFGEMSDLFLTSQRVTPRAAVAAGFRFRFAGLRNALEDLLGGRALDVARPLAAMLNEECGFCSATLGHCRRVAAASGASIALKAVGEAPHALSEWGLDEAALRRRLYVVDGDGEVRSGVEAVLAIGRALPRYRALARALDAPGLRQLAEIAYEGALVPLLAAWNEAGRKRS